MKARIAAERKAKSGVGNGGHCKICGGAAAGHGKGKKKQVDEEGGSELVGGSNGEFY